MTAESGPDSVKSPLGEFIHGLIIMSQKLTPEQTNMRIQEIARADGRYRPEAFFLVTEAIGRTVEWLKTGAIAQLDSPESRGDCFHVSGRELLVGLRRLARERWGCMARIVLSQWGVRRTEDVGEIVFIMVEDEELDWRKRDADTRADFADGFDFAAAFDPWDE